MITVYTHKISNRLEYILDFILKDYMGVPYKLELNYNAFIAVEGAKLNYSMDSFDVNNIHVFPSLLLFQEDLTEHQIVVKEWDGVKIFYSVSKGDLPFDLFAATFFMITRYEEYLYAKRDRFGRYDPRNSIAWKNGFLYEPIVNIWLNRFRDLLKSKYPELKLKEQQYTYQPTLDIDNAWAYLHKGFIRTTGGLILNGLKHRFLNFDKRFRVLLGLDKDPFDTYDVINQVHSKHDLKPYIFFLMGNYGGNDKSISPLNKYYHELIKQYAKIANVGIHGSFSASNNAFHLKEEIEFLTDILEDGVDSNRFHFIKIKMPDSFEELIDQGIKHDFTMGYASRLGFRAGYAGQYYFFNLKTNSSSNLRIHPFQIMDATLNFYNKLSPDLALEKSIEIIDKIKNVKGELGTVWHNESLSGINPWKGWDSLYEKVVDHAAPSVEN